MRALFEQGRIKSKLRLSEVSDKTNISQERILEIETETSEPDIYEIMTLGQLYNSFELILYGRNKEITLGVLFNSYRRGLGIKADDLAKRVGTSARTIYRIEADERKIDIPLCTKIQKELNIDTFIFNKIMEKCKKKQGENISSKKYEYLKNYNVMMRLSGQQPKTTITDNEYEVMRQFLRLKAIKRIIASLEGDKLSKCS